MQIDNIEYVLHKIWDIIVPPALAFIILMVITFMLLDTSVIIQNFSNTVYDIFVKLKSSNVIDSSTKDIAKISDSIENQLPAIATILTYIVTAIALLLSVFSIISIYILMWLLRIAGVILPPRLTFDHIEFCRNISSDDRLARISAALRGNIEIREFFHNMSDIIRYATKDNYYSEKHEKFSFSIENIRNILVILKFSFYYTFVLGALSALNVFEPLRDIKAFLIVLIVTSLVFLISSILYMVAHDKMLSSAIMFSETNFINSKNLSCDKINTELVDIQKYKDTESRIKTGAVINCIMRAYLYTSKHKIRAQRPFRRKGA